MIQLKSKLFQPLTLQKADGTGLHLLSRGVTTITDAEMSPDIRRAESRGHITITTLSEPSPAPEPETPGEELSAKPKKGGRR